MSVILHSDLNCFYASVEMNEAPHLKDQMVAVCGSTENRHGIVLTASYPAKRHGVKTGMANWQAKQACPDLIMVPPHYDMYLKYSRIFRRIYKRYSQVSCKCTSDTGLAGTHKSDHNDWFVKFYCVFISHGWHCIKKFCFRQ